MSEKPGATRVRGRFVIGYDGRGHVILEDAEVVFAGDAILFVGRGYDGPVEREIDADDSVVAPGFVDLNALADLDSTVLGFDNQPDRLKGRVWSEAYLRRGPREVYSAEEQDFARRYAMVQLIMNGVTTAQPIASLLYRAWAESYDEMARMAEIGAGLGLRLFLGSAFMSGLTFVRADGNLDRHFDEPRGLAGLDDAIRFVRDFDGRFAGLINGMLAPDRIETCTEELLRRTAVAARELGCPVRLHCCQSRYEFDTVMALRGATPIQWLGRLGFLGPRVMLPHGVYLTGTSYTGLPGICDQELLVETGAALVTCPLVAARYGDVMESFARYRAMGIRIGFGTDTFPPDMLANLREAIHLCRIVDKDAIALTAAEAFTAATIGGADALGRADLGRLAPGCKADIVVFGLDAFELGQLVDPIQSLLIAGTGRDVRMVIINGRIAMENRRIPGVDLEQLRTEAQAQYDRLRATYPERTPGSPPIAAMFRPAFRSG
jgi:cytosine/adenosine deaminase-related metal-dependent hydrolase